MSIATVAPTLGSSCVSSSRVSTRARGVRRSSGKTVSQARRGLTVVDGHMKASAPQIATVSSLDDAPSRRRRLERLRAEDPTVRRQPHYPRGASDTSTAVSAAELLAMAYQAIHAGIARLRMRHVGIALVYGLILAGAVYGGLAAQGEGYSGPTVVHSVRSGESVWSLAAAVNSDRPLEEVVVDIERLNNVNGGLIRGQQIILPTR